MNQLETQEHSLFLEQHRPRESRAVDHAAKEYNQFNKVVK